MALEESLLKLGITLNFYIGDASIILQQYISKNGNSTKVFCNKSFNPIQLKIDKEVIDKLPNPHALCYVGQDMLVNPTQIKNSSGKNYKIYSPYAAKLRGIIKNKRFKLKKLKIKQYFSTSKSITKLSDLNLINEKEWSKKFYNNWFPGELEAIKAFDNFVSNNINHYAKNRDNFYEQDTSKISAYINFGELSIDYIYSKVIENNKKYPYTCELSSHQFLNQIIWREFAKYSLFYNQKSYLESIYGYCDSDILWSGDDILFELWKQAKTGVNIVDASMQQLWDEGWMPNRARMVSASFLTKNLGIHWAKGFKWFWDTLIDADLASNAMGWQWVAGTAPYSAQFNRIFNPYLQEKKFDPDHKYVQKYLNQNRAIKPIVSVPNSSKEAKIRYQKIKLLQNSLKEK